MTAQIIEFPARPRERQVSPYWGLIWLWPLVFWAAVIWAVL